MDRYYVPPTKGELVDWLMEYARRSGLSWKRTGLQKLRKHQLYAMFYKVRKG